jgi:hypothetical protein
VGVVACLLSSATVYYKGYIINSDRCLCYVSAQYDLSHTYGRPNEHFFLLFSWYTAVRVCSVALQQCGERSTQAMLAKWLKYTEL